LEKKPSGDEKFIQNNEVDWINLPQTKT